MGENSKIEWTDHTFNPWRGCTKVSPGCAHCYAETLSHRNPGTLGVWGDKGTRVVAAESAWREPLKWDRAAKAAGERHRVFCASLADVFEDRPELVAPRVRLFHLINDTPNLDWLLLTKRPENIRRMSESTPGSWSLSMPPNVWLGTSVENQATANERIPHLLTVPAAVHFLSIEPLLGPVDLAHLDEGPETCPDCGEVPTINCLHLPNIRCSCCDEGAEPLAWHRLDWIIVGGESGPKARPMHPDWARSIRDQCQAAGVAFHFKQWVDWLPDNQQEAEPGTWPHIIQGKQIARLDAAGRDLAGLHGLHDESDIITRRVGKKAAGRLLDGRTWDELPTPKGVA